MITEETQNRLIELASEILEEMRATRISMQNALNKVEKTETEAAEVAKEKRRIKPSFYKPDEPQL